MESFNAPTVQQQPWNLLQKPIRVEMLESPFSKPVFDDDNFGVAQHFVGLNAEILHILSAMMNFSIIYQDADPVYGYALENGSFAGAIGRLLTNQSDIGMTLFFIRDYGTTDIEFTTPIHRDQLCIVVRKAHKIPEAVLPLLTFSLPTWISLLLSFVGCSVFWMGLRIVNVKQMFVDSAEQLYMMTTFSDYVHIVVDTGILFISSPLVRLPKIWSERIFVISICLMSTIVFAYFQSTLATVFGNPLYVKDINSLGELEDTNLPIEIRVRLAIDPLFDEKSSLLQRIKIVDENYPSHIHIANNGKSSVVLKQTAIMFDFSHFFRLQRLHQLPDCLRTYLTAYVLPKKSAYFERINEILLRLAHSGLIQKWITDTTYNWTVESTRVYRGVDKIDFVVLGLTNVLFPLYILFGGYVLGVFLFIGELCSNDAKLYIVKKKKRFLSK